MFPGVVLCNPDNVGMPKTLVDLSNNQGAGGLLAITDPAVAAVYAKATEGLGFEDAWYPRYRDQAHKLGKPFGAYLFLHPDQDGAQQARNFLAHAKPVPGDLEPVVDAELPPGGSVAAARTTYAALAEIESHGFSPLLYASTSFLRAILSWEPRLSRFRVWQAEYGPVLHRVPGLNAVAWQFTDRLTVAKGRLRVDGDRLLVRNLDAIRIPAHAKVSHPGVVVPLKKPKPRRKYETFKKDVKLKPGEMVAYKGGRGYYAAPKPSGGGGPKKAA